MELRPNGRGDFVQKLESEILALFRKRKGFKDEITFVSPEGKNVVAFSLWENKESAEAYSHGSYAEVTKILSRLVRGKQRVKNFEVASSTIQNIGAKLKVA
jgi:hypothetical protein